MDPNQLIIENQETMINMLNDFYALSSMGVMALCLLVGFKLFQLFRKGADSEHIV